MSSSAAAETAGSLVAFASNSFETLQLVLTYVRQMMITVVVLSRKEAVETRAVAV